jgi:hypothetical protein
MTKLEKIEIQEQKTREKIAAMQALLKQIDGQRTEQENLQIIQQVRALKLSREDLYMFLNGGELPASLMGAFGGNASTSEKIYSRREKKRKNTQDTTEESQTEASENGENNNFESEVTHHEN